MPTGKLPVETRAINALQAADTTMTMNPLFFQLRSICAPKALTRQSTPEMTEIMTSWSGKSLPLILSKKKEVTAASILPTNMSQSQNVTNPFRLRRGTHRYSVLSISSLAASGLGV